MGSSIESLPTDAEILQDEPDCFGEPLPLFSRSSRREGVTFELDPLPVLTLGSPRGLRVIFTTGFLLSFGLFLLGGWAFWALIAGAAGTTVGSMIGLSSMPTDPLSSDPVAFAIVFALALQASSLLYTLGHGLGYTLNGRYLAAIELGIGARAYPSEDAKNSYQQLGSTFVGGLIQPLVGILGLLVVGGPGWSVLQISFLVILGIGLLNLLIPAGRRSSATKFWLSLGRVLAGRGRRPLKISTGGIQAPPVSQLEYMMAMDDLSTAKD